MKKVVEILIFLIVLTLLLAELNQLRLIGQAEKTDDIVPARYQTVNKERAACIIFVTDLNVDLDFRPRVELVALVQPAPGQFHVFVAPGERVIDIHALGYRPLRVVLRDFGIMVLGSGDVYELQLTGDRREIRDKDVFTIQFEIEPSDVFISTDSRSPVLVKGNTAQFRISAGIKSFTFIKSGYRDETIELNVNNDLTRIVTLQRGTSSYISQQTGTISINSDPTGGQIYINDQYVGNTPYSGELLAGSYNYSIINLLYEPQIGDFVLNEGQNLTLPALILTPRFGGILNIDSNPQGAEIIINAQNRGITPLTRFRVERGEYELKLKYNLYHTHKEIITIHDGDEKNININMRPAFGELNINSYPEEGATIYIDDIRVGTTPYRSDRQPSGIYEIKVEKNLWKTATRSIVVSDGTTTNESFLLDPNFGTISVVSDASDIYLNDIRLGKDSYQSRIQPGSYVFIAKKNRYNDATASIDLQISQDVTIKLEPTPRLGWLNIIAEHEDAHGAEIWIDGVRKEETTPALIPLLFGDYEVKIRKYGFVDQLENISIQEGHTYNSKIEMSTTVLVKFDSEPSGATLYIDNQRIGITPISTQAELGIRQIILKKAPEYLDFEGVVNITQETKIFEFEMTLDPVLVKQKEAFLKTIYDINEEKALLFLVNSLLNWSNTSPMLKVLYLNEDVIFVIPPSFFKIVLISERDYSSGLSNLIISVSLVGETMVSFNQIVVDLGSLGIGYIYATSNHKRRMIWESGGGFRYQVPYNLTYSGFKRTDFKKGNYSHSIPLFSEINLEFCIGKSSFLVFTGGVLWGTRDKRKWYLESDVERYLDEGGVKPEPYDVPGLKSPFMDGFYPYFGAGIRF